MTSPSDDVRTQCSPYLYDLYAVINHDGETTLSGHYTAVVRSENQWMELDDTQIRPLPESRVMVSAESSVGKSA